MGAGVAGLGDPSGSVPRALFAPPAVACDMGPADGDHGRRNRDHVVTCFLHNRGEVLLVRRGPDVGSYPGRWGGISGFVEGDPADALDDARRELSEETGRADATLVRSGDPLDVDDGDRAWTVHPFLFEAPDRAVEPNRELDAVEWVSPPAMRGRETVPRLWETYRRVAPTVADVREDRDHGSAWLSLRALEALRDAAAVADDWAAVAAVARDLREARPAMAAVGNRVNRAMSASDRTPASAAAAATALLADAVDADERAAATAADWLPGPLVATLSRSGTVAAALRDADCAVLLAESRPGGEGVGVAEELAEDGLSVTLTTDAALPGLVGRADGVLLGADAVLSDGRVVNKVGSRALALAAGREGVPVGVACASAKVRPDDAVHGEARDASEVYDGDAPVRVENPVFEAVPADLVDAVCTERGPLDADGVAAVAADHRALSAWEGRNAED
jgi:translation initiation factor 2B subunit (eIF-2B alpha/beta/delta family)